MIAARLPLLLLLLGCATPRQEPLPPARSASTAERSAGYQDAVEVVSASLASEGHADAELQEVTELRPNYWKLRFGLAPKGSGKLLEVYFDGARREIVRKELIPRPD